MMDRTKQRLQKSQPKSPNGGDGDDPAGGDNDKDDRDEDRGSGSGHMGDHGNSKGRTGGGGRGNRSSGVRKSDRFQGGAGGEDPGVDELVTIEVCLPQSRKCPDQPDHQHQETIQVANKRNMLLLYLQYGVYDSPIPASFIRSAPSIMAKAQCPTPPLSPRTIRPYTPNECLSIALISEIGQGATGIVHSN
jgi:hypothetical protein